MSKKDEQCIYYINKHYGELNKELALINFCFEEYKENKVIQKAIKMDLFQIGEHFVNLSEESVKNINPKDLKGIRDIRNFIAHGYIQIKDAIIWNTLINDLPRLIKSLNSQNKLIRVDEAK